MDIHQELGQLRRRIGLIEDDLSVARRQLETLEARAGAESPVADPVIEAVSPRVPMLPPPLPMPPPLAEPRVEAAPLEPVVKPVPEWKTWLQRLQLWPSAEGDNNEVHLGAWWATRLGTVLAVIGVVFFGVYVSLDTPALVKFSELLAICVGVAAGGLWLERRLPRFGSVVFAGGLALVYFCAFAGYALPAVKVVASLPAAVGWQLAAVLLIAGAAVTRKSPAIATMAVGLGYVSAVFSRTGGLHDFALMTAALLAVAAVVFHRRWQCEGPGVVALPGTYLVYALVWEGNWLHGNAPAAVWPWVFLGGVATLFFVRDWRFQRVEHGAVTTGEKWFQGMNSSLAVFLGVVTALTLYRGQLAEFYFWTALLLGGFAALRRRQVSGDALAAVLVAKASGALTLGVIEALHGRTPALALLVQAYVMLFSARRLHSRVLVAGSGVVAAVATGYFFKDAEANVALWSLSSAAALAFVVGLVWLAVTAVRGALKSQSAEVRAWVEGTAAVAAAAAAAMTVFNLAVAGSWAPAVLMGVAAVLGAPGVWRRALAPVAAGLLLVGVAQYALWQHVEMGIHRPGVVANALVVLLPAALIGLGLSGRLSAARSGAWERVLRAVGCALCVVVLGGLAHVLFAQRPSAEALAWMVIASLALGWSAGVWRDRHFAWLAAWSGFLGVAWWFERGQAVTANGWLAFAAVGLWALPAVMQASRCHREASETEPASGVLVFIQVLGALLISLNILPAYVTGFWAATGYGWLALLVFALGRKPGVRFALEASWVLWVAAGWRLVAYTPSFWAPEAGYGATFSAGLALLAWGPSLVLARSSEKRGEGMQAILATVLAVLVCHHRFNGADTLLALWVALAVTVVVHRVGSVKSAWWSCVALATWMTGCAGQRIALGGAEGWCAGSAAVLLAALGLAALPLMIADVAPARRLVGPLRWSGGVASLGVVFFAALAQQGALHPYASIGWGLASIVLFMTGLFARQRPYRMLGLIGLAVCVPRIFIVDLDSVLHRIAAFVVLGLVLLWVGFSYHRFRHLIADEPPGN